MLLSPFEKFMEISLPKGLNPYTKVEEFVFIDLAVDRDWWGEGYVATTTISSKLYDVEVVEGINKYIVSVVPTGEESKVNHPKNEYLVIEILRYAGEPEELVQIVKRELEELEKVKMED